MCSHDRNDRDSGGKSLINTRDAVAAAQGSSEAAARRPRPGHIAPVEPGVSPRPALGPGGTRPRPLPWEPGRSRCPRVSAPPLRAPGTMVPRGAVTARGEHGPFKSGAAMICLVLGLFAGLFHNGTERDGTPGRGLRSGDPHPLVPEGQGPPFPGRDPAAEGPGQAPLSLCPLRPGPPCAALPCGNLGTPCAPWEPPVPYAPCDPPVPPGTPLCPVPPGNPLCPLG